MIIKQIDIQNFRCFEEKSLSFVKTFNVLIGDNGTGKTTILDALAIGLSDAISRFGIDPEITFHKNDAHRKRTEINGIVNYEITGHPSTSITALINDNFVKWSSCRTDTTSKMTSADYEITEFRNWLHTVRQGEKKPIPCFAYYGTQRLLRGASIEKSDPGKSSRVDAYKGCLISGMDLKALTLWFRDMEFKELKQKQPIGVLNAVRNAIAACIEDCEKVEFDPDCRELQITLKGGCNLPISQLSDGYCNMLGMVGDIAFRAAVLNPHLGEKAPELTQGVILIDEIDLHLHPKWQRRVVGDLRKVFSHMQFIVTTHSPFIIQNIKPGELIKLPEPTTSDYVNKSIEDIAEYTMGVEIPQRSQKYQDMSKTAEEYYKVLSLSENAHGEELEELKQKLDEMSEPFSDDPAYTAFLKMERLAKLGDKA